MTCDHSACGYTWPDVRVGELPVRGEDEPASHFADRVSFFHAAKGARFNGSLVVAEMGKQGKQEARDMEAYKSLRKQGLQPAGIDGCHELTARATSVADVDVAAGINRDREILADRGLEFTR